MQLPIEKEKPFKKPGDPGYEQHKKWQAQIEKARAAARAQDQSLATAEIPSDIKIKIRDKFTELAIKYPKWTRDKIMRRAGEAYGVKFDFI